MSQFAHLPQSATRRVRDLRPNHWHLQAYCSLAREVRLGRRRVKHRANGGREMTDSSIPSGDDLRLIDELSRVEQALRFRLGGRVHDLRLWLEPHGLVLTGRASSYYDKQQAQHLLKELSNLGVADNRIVVDLPSAGTGLGPNLDLQHHRHRKGEPPHSVRGHHLATAYAYFYAR